MFSKDEIRTKILNYFHERNINATSRYGLKGSAVKSRDLKHDLKEQYGFGQKEVVSNLSYLIDKGLVKELETTNWVSTKEGLLVNSVTRWYEITAEGIDRVEGLPKGTIRFPGIDLQDLPHTFTVLDDGSIVHVDNLGLHSNLTSFEREISSLERIPYSEKLDLIADIETIKDQLAKPHPNKNVIEGALSEIKEKLMSIHKLHLLEQIQISIEKI